MTYFGHIERGVLVLDTPVVLPEGAKVQCSVIPAESEESLDPDKMRNAPLRRGLMSFAGKAEGLPADASGNLDHYLYGHTKK